MAEEEEGAPLMSTCKRKQTNEVPTNAETKRPARRSATPSNKVSETAGGNACTYGKFCINQLVLYQPKQTWVTYHDELK
jgi:hypothetical protein